MKNRLRIFLTSVLLSTVLLVRAQTTTLTGRVTDAANGQPLPFASVFVNNTTLGVNSDEAGNFKLTNVPLGSVEVVASYVGYAPARQVLRLETAQPRTLALALTPTGQNLNEVTVTAKRDKTWERQLREFRRELLGQTSFATQCDIVNAHVLRFDEAGGHLRAQASEPLVIENGATGYRLRYVLQHFDAYQGMAFYGGQSQFEELKPENDRQARRWQQARQLAYRGSLQHLLASLAAGTHEAEGFLVYQTAPGLTPLSTPPTISQETGRYLRPVNPLAVVHPGRLPFERRLVSNVPLAVYYTKPTLASPTVRPGTHQYGEIILPQGRLEMTATGWITLPMEMRATGFFGFDRLATLLPADWTPDGTGGTAPTTTPPAEGQVLAADARLDSLGARWAKLHQSPAPGVFLHPDKGFYAGGDRLWLSGYVLHAANHQLRTGEEALHVDLLGPDQRLVQHHWLKATDGRAAGDFRLPDTLATGTYRLRAYTEGDRFAPRPAFERPLLIYNLAKGAGRTPHAADSLDVQVLPEGGRWVVGQPARLGVKVLDTEGRGRAMSGRIFDEKNTEVARFTTNAYGMTSLQLTPEAGRRYRVVLRAGLDAGSAPLPPAEVEGLSLSADWATDSTRLTLRVLGTGRYAAQAVYVVVQSRGRVRHTTKIGLQAGRARLDVPTAKLPPGLAQVTLFDQTGRPWAERLVFVPDPEPPVTVSIFSEKASHAPGDTVTVRLELRQDGQPLLASLSASVTDTGQVPADSLVADLRTHLLLTGDLRGRVENPLFYFRKNSPEIHQALDDLLLTQGWRRVGWQAAPADTATAPRAMVLRAQVFDERRRAAPGAELFISSSDLKQAYGRTVKTDDRGFFSLNDVVLRDTVRLLVKATDRDGRPFTALVLPQTTESWFAETTPHPAFTDVSPLRALADAAQARHNADPEAYREPGAKLLPEVKVKTPAPRPVQPESQRRGAIHNRADAVVTFDEKSPRFTNVFEMLNGRVAGLRVFRRADGSGYSVLIGGQQTIMSGTDPLYLLDGAQVDANTLNAINPQEIERIEVIKGSDASLYGVRGANGIVAFYSRRGDSPAPEATSARPGMSEFTFRGFRTAREFYTPKRASTRPEAPAQTDRRDVLFWQPLLPTDAQGGAVLRFTLSDVARALRVSVQGITTDGRAVSGVGVIGVR